MDVSTLGHFFSKILSIVEHGSGMVTPRSDNGHS
nr:MAG TPA: hypothetical protein [Bacteriophage sp.]